jgi:hypothetical protein
LNAAEASEWAAAQREVLGADGAGAKGHASPPAWGANAVRAGAVEWQLETAAGTVTLREQDGALRIATYPLEAFALSTPMGAARSFGTALRLGDTALLRLLMPNSAQNRVDDATLTRLVELPEVGALRGQWAAGLERAPDTALVALSERAAVVEHDGQRIRLVVDAGAWRVQDVAPLRDTDGAATE